jgi:hypothetical protein
MERYGYLFTRNPEHGAFPNNDVCVEKINQSFFKNLSDCIRNALYCDSAVGKESRRYFKILKNADVVKHIHDINGQLTFGYCYVYIQNEQAALFSACNKLYNNMLECVSEKKSEYENECLKDENYVIKIGYFVVLSDDDIVRELHRTSV